MIQHPFILRFQEFFGEPVLSGPGSGTQTITNVRAEGFDSDDKGRRHEAFAASIPSGTLTATFVAAEAGDKDPEKPKYNVFNGDKPEHTMSITAVRAEAADEGRGAQATSAFPKQKSLIAAGTQTHTRIQAEQSDEDRGRKEFEAIPQCFLS